MLQPITSKVSEIPEKEVAATCIDVKNLSHTYSDGHVALRNVSFQVQAGARIGIVGANGAGKTTLFLKMAGILPPKQGAITIAGIDPATDRKKLPAQLGIVFQNPDDQLFSSTVIEDVAFGPLNLGFTKQQAYEKATAALAKVNLSKCADRSPVKLSGGEKRRAAIAGILAMEPQIWLLDEPSMFLDPRSRRELINIINKLQGTIVIASHDLSLIHETCTHTILMHDGKVICNQESKDVLFNYDLMMRHEMEPLQLL